MEETMETTEVEEEYEEEYEEGGPSGLSLALNRYFHHIDRGGSLGGEITAGIVMFFVSICVIFMNMQLIGGVLNAGVTLTNTPADPKNIAAATVYTQLYAGSILASIPGTLLAGIVARLPFNQVSTMGLASSLLCLVGTETGLTWQNLLFINLVAAVIFAVAAALYILLALLKRKHPVILALVCGAVANIAAPFFGVGGMSFGVGSVAAARDNGKSGISSIVAGIGFAISLFVMAFPALFATVTHPVASMNEWNYFAYGNGGFVYLVQDVVFTVADFVMICLGVGMAASLAKLD